jgi:hypothetical protein
VLTWAVTNRILSRHPLYNHRIAALPSSLPFSTSIYPPRHPRLAHIRYQGRQHRDIFDVIPSTRSASGIIAFARVNLTPTQRRSPCTSWSRHINSQSDCTDGLGTIKTRRLLICATRQYRGSAGCSGAMCTSIFQKVSYMYFVAECLKTVNHCNMS